MQNLSKANTFLIEIFKQTIILLVNKMIHFYQMSACILNFTFTYLYVFSIDITRQKKAGLVYMYIHIGTYL